MVEVYTNCTESSIKLKKEKNHNRFSSLYTHLKNNEEYKMIILLKANKYAEEIH